MNSFHRPLLAILCALFLLPVQTLAQPGALLEKNQHIPQRFERSVVTCGEPLAAQVGAAILAQGGNAVDSATAVGLALAVTLPRAGNLGGGGFALILDQDKKVHALDFRETAPAALHREFYREQGRSSRRGPTSIGVPGTVAGLWEMHQRFGVLPWNEVVNPSYRLAEEGIPVSAWLNDGINSSINLLGESPASRKIFLREGRAPAVGELFLQRDLARTLKRISRHGPDDFYRGQTAKLLLEGIQGGGGVMSRDDLEGYRALWREPVFADIKGYRVWSMPPPSSGGIHLLQMLKWMEEQSFESSEHNSAGQLHKLAEVMRLAYSDRARYLGDPDFVEVPVQKLLSETYLRQRQALVPEERAGNSEALAPELFQNPLPESPDTTHFNVVDEQGMAVSLTYTLNFSYGSGFVAPGTGFLLNNEMDDFNADPGQPNAYGLIGSSANDIEAGKRPLSSMTPTLITKDGRFFAALGAPGGSRIINGVLQATVNVLYYGLNAQTAVNMPRIHHQWYPDEITYEFGISKDSRAKLEAMGHSCRPIDAVAHVLAVIRHETGYLETGLDPRRPAYAEGD